MVVWDFYAQSFRARVDVMLLVYNMSCYCKSENKFVEEVKTCFKANVTIRLLVRFLTEKEFASKPEIKIFMHVEQKSTDTIFTIKRVRTKLPPTSLIKSSC